MDNKSGFVRVAHDRRTAPAGRHSARRRRRPPHRAAGGADITSANAHFFASPMPVVLHVVAAVGDVVTLADQAPRGFTWLGHEWPPASLPNMSPPSARCVCRPETTELPHVLA